MAKSGHDVIVTSDLSEAAKIKRDVGKSYSHPVSEVLSEDLMRGRAFWVGVRQDGNYVACVSARFSEIEVNGFAEYWRGFCRSKYPERGCVVSAVSDVANTLIQGRAVYFGGVEVKQGHKGNISRLSRMVEFSKLQAAFLWDFDCIYTVINREHRALSRLYKFGDILEGAVEWFRPVPEGLANDQLLLVERRLDFNSRLGA